MVSSLEDDELTLYKHAPRTGGDKAGTVLLPLAKAILGECADYLMGQTGKSL